MAADEPLLLYAPPSKQTPVRFVKGVGEEKAKMLADSRFGIRSVQDLIQHYPRRHLDFSETKPIRETGVGDEVTIIGTVRRVQAPPPSKRKIPLKVVLSDGTSSISLAFFNQPWRARQLPPGTRIAAKGKVTSFRGVRQMNAPMVDVISEANEVVRIVPLYPATADITTVWLRRIVRNALEHYSPLSDPLPEWLRRKRGLMDRTQALTTYHFPAQLADKDKARRRLVFDELFTLQTGLAYHKARVKSQEAGIAHRREGDLAERFVAALPFPLTSAQRRAIHEISEDLSSPSPMHRLLQGEVGSGKTVVALYAALLAVQGGHQAAIMAPTEVLAGQHFLTVSSLIRPLSGGPGEPGEDGRGSDGQLDLFGESAGPGVVLLTGSLPASRRRDALARIASGAAGIVIGTHALLEEGVSFANLGLAVIDEQHRFGVHQRMVLRDKRGAGITPDLLIMTATPIPRTLALTLYGDLDVSELDELPKGRRAVTTKVVGEDGRKEAYDLVRAQVAGGRQAYVITPLVSESDKLEVKSAEAEAERLRTEIFPDLRVDLLHGRMRPAAKEAVMQRFRAGEIDVLISTTVVEVGVDVPNATVMLIEDADRFGLSQLHQLRGRIGRGAHPGICLLLTGVVSGDGGPRPALGEEDRVKARARLEAVAATSDGFKLAEKDLEIRGSGTIMDERQAGFSDLRLTNLLNDQAILAEARTEAFALIEADPELNGHPMIRMEMEGRFADRLEWLFQS
ncbi:MAG TPA: ATP-dependent DNA helicase RecG [Actinomycetota bacterium]|nr:ATP-dependent DNA helicase RecG [Actinomycetota bacterium]